MRIVVNGEQREVPAGTSIADIIRSLDVDPEQGGIAVARNREVLSRSRWQTTEVEADDRLEILNAVQGGAQDGPWHAATDRDDDPAASFTPPRPADAGTPTTKETDDG